MLHVSVGLAVLVIHSTDSFRFSSTLTSGLSSATLVFCELCVSLGSSVPVVVLARSDSGFHRADISTPAGFVVMLRVRTGADETCPGSFVIVRSREGPGILVDLPRYESLSLGLWGDWSKRGLLFDCPLLLILIMVFFCSLEMSSH